MTELWKINVNKHTERKGQAVYLSWAWAWQKLLEVDPAARWTAHEWNDMPVMYLKDGSAMVKVSVELKGDIKTAVLPVMDHRNKAIQNPDAFQVNTAIMRALCKAAAMHGLGLYLYQAEGFPEGDPGDPDLIDKIKALPDITSLSRFFKQLSPDDRMRYTAQFTARKKELTEDSNGSTVA